MELKYEIGFRRKIFESIFISNLNQVILRDRTRDMDVFVGHVQALSEYLISYDIQNTARFFHLNRARLVPKVIWMLASISKWFEVISYGHKDIQVLVRRVKSAKRSKPVQPHDEVTSSHWIVSYQIYQVMFSSGGVDARCPLFPLTMVFSTGFPGKVFNEATSYAL